MDNNNNNNNYSQENNLNNQITNNTVQTTNLMDSFNIGGTSLNNDNTISQKENSPKKKGILVIFGMFLIIAIVLVVTLFVENSSGFNNNQNLIQEDTKSLIVYFSHDGENYGKNLDIENKRVLTVGNTEIMAKRIAKYIDADLYEIEPVVAYPNDLNELYSASKIEYNKNTYPEIKSGITNLDEYDVIFIGYPIWHSSYPQIIKTFVRDYKNTLKNKIIVPFNTHAGSGSAGTYKKLFNLIGCEENKGLNGLAINGTEVETSDDVIKSWLNGIGYKIK